MEKPDFVIDLIRSLSKPEKRYFKLFASRYKQDGEKKYLRIFSVFEKMRSNHPSELAGKLKEENYSGYLAGDKHYLSELLMSSLRQFHADSSVHLRLHAELMSVELLRNKGLYAHALKKLLRVKKEAQKFEMMELWLQTLNLEKEIRSKGALDWLETASALFKASEELLEKMRVLDTLDRQRVELLLLAAEKGRPQTGEERADWEQRLAVFQEDESLTGLKSEQSLRLRAKAYALFVMRDVEAAERINRQRYLFFRDHPEQVEKSLMEYVHFLFFYTSTSTQVNDFEKAAALLQELRALRKQDGVQGSPPVCKAIDDRLLPTEIYVFGKSGQHHRIREMEPEAELFFKKIKPGSVRGTFIINMATSFLFGADYQGVLRWTHRSVSQGIDKNDYVIFIANRLMQIIAHLELGDYEVAASLSTATQRYVQQRKESAGTDLAFIHLFRKCAGTDERSLQNSYAKEFLQAHASDPVFSRAEEYLPLRTWVYARGAE